MEAPTLQIGKWPTPIRRLESCSRSLGVEVWAKVEDGSGTWSATKVRKLEYLLADARRRGRDRVTTYGVGSSTWCAATARYAPGAGFLVRIAVAGDVPDHLIPAYADPSVRLTELPGHAALPAAYASARASAVRHGSFLHAGGSGGLGDLGSMGAGKEIAAAVAAGELPEPNAVFVAAGTGGTAAGLAVGLHEARLATAVIAARVTPLPLGSASLIRHRIAKLLRLLDGARGRRDGARGLRDPSEVRFEVDDRFHTPGYGRANDASLEAAEMARDDGLEPDATYTAKAFAALVAAARSGRPGPLLLLDTSPGPGLSPSALA